jgi:glycosyltransferase involved in cell wall biosynthesis
MNNISILLPLYQRNDLEECFERVISSCFNGMIKPDEIIIALDGQINQSFEVKISKMAKTLPIKIIQSENRIGLSSVLNLGLKHVKTEYTFRVDGDDFSRPERWEKQLNLLNSGFDLVGGAIQEITSDGHSLAIRRMPEFQDDIKKMILRRNPFNHMTCAYRTSIVRAVGGYPHVFLREDWALWVRMIAHGAKCQNIPEILVDATTDIEMYKRRGGVSNVMAEIKMQKFLIEHLNKSLLQAFVDWCLKASVLLAPSKIREIIYLKILRRQ